MIRRPVLAVATSVGIALGLGAAVATMPPAEPARHRESASAAELRATTVDVGLAAGADRGGAGELPGRAHFPTDALDRVRRLPGVVAVGYYADLEGTPLGLSTMPPGSDAPARAVRLIGADENLIDAAGARVVGTGISRWQVAHRARVALVGAGVGNGLDAQPWILVGGVPYVVIGRVEDGGRLPFLTSSVVVPASVQEDLYPGATPRLVLHVEPGAAPAVTRAAPRTLDPIQPGVYAVPEPHDPRPLRRELSVLGILLVVCAVVERAWRR